jgi:hypothetical protein
VVEDYGERRDDDQQPGDSSPANPDPTGCSSCCLAVGHAAIEGTGVLPARMRFSIRRRYARLGPPADTALPRWNIPAAEALERAEWQACKTSARRSCLT